MAPPSDLRRPFKRPQISDQQRRRELSLKRQEQSRDAELHARRLATTVLSLPPSSDSEPEPEPELVPGSSSSSDDCDLRDASKLKGPAARKWFAKQLMLPEWMIDVPHRLPHDWYVLPRPAGKRCFVVSSGGTTISRLRNGTVLHRFPSALPHGNRNRDGTPPSNSILDCIFHEMDQTYYVIDMVCWRDYSYYDCSTEFRFTWLKAKLAETDACKAPSYYHRFRFSPVPWWKCDLNGLQDAYTGEVPFVKDGLLFMNKHAHYQPGNTPLALVWKDERCSQYVIDTDNSGQVPSHQQVVLELQADGQLTTSDDPPVVLGCLNLEFIEQSGLETGCFLRCAIGDGGLTIVDGMFQWADLHYLGKSNRARAFADTYSKVMFQNMARRSPLRIEDLVASIRSSDYEANGVESHDVEMAA